MKRYYDDNKVKMAAYCVKYHQANKELRNQYSQEYYQARRRNNLEVDMLARCKYRAKRNGWEFNLTREDIQIPALCPVLKIPISPGVSGKKGGTPNSPSIDRINPKAGYVRGNVRVISNRANTLKCDATVAELEAVLADLRQLNPHP